VGTSRGTYLTRTIHRLSAADLKRKKVGTYADGGGLWLQATFAADGKQINRSWLFIYTLTGRTREMGLGSLNTVSLGEARQAALQCRKLLLAGSDPIEHRNTERAERAANAAKVKTFDECVREYLQEHRRSWRSEKHAKQWPSTLAAHVSPVFGKLSVAAIDTALVVKALRPVWQRTPETASRLRGRIEAILDWAAVSGFRPAGDNPARWKGHLEHVFAARQKKLHLAALPYTDIPEFMVKLRNVPGTIARAIEFTILNAARRNEMLGAKWAEIDFADKVWTVPANRTKANKEHKIPLSGRALEILKTQSTFGGKHSDLIFKNGDRPLVGETLINLLKRVRPEITLHGFRSSFRDWAGDHTAFARDVVEAALAHAIENKAEAAYRRMDALQKRRRLMQAWADYCAKPATGAVTPIRRVGGDA
jgi:integrase